MKVFQKNSVILLMGLLLLVPVTMFGQQERKYIRKGNRLYDKEKFNGSEIQYRRAQGIDKPIPDANFNVGDALYKQKKYSEAAENFDQSLSAYKTPGELAETFYNKGNALLKDNKFKESIEAYINSLKLSPDNVKAKYNLAYAQNMLKKQQEQEKQQQNQQNKDDKQKKDQDKKDQDKQNQDQNKQNQDKQNQDQNKQNQDKQNQDQNKQNQDQQNQNKDQNQQNKEGQQPQMSKEDAKRLLDALSANEKDVQDKVNKDKMAKGYVRVTKNW